MFFEIGIFKNFENFTWSIFLIKFIKKNFNTGVFPAKFATFLKTPCFREHVTGQRLNVKKGGYSREFLRKHLQLVVSIIYRFFLQYQWMQFYISSLAIFYYFPYIMFQLINTDVISLSDSLKDGNLDAENFARNFFNYKVNTKTSMRVKVLGNHLIKVSAKPAQSQQYRY